MEATGTLSALVKAEKRAGGQKGCAGMHMAAVLEKFFMECVDVVEEEVGVGLNLRRRLARRQREEGRCALK